MITRYIDIFLSEIWGLRHQYEIWLDLELAVWAAQSRMQEEAPLPPALHITDRAMARISQLEVETRHDVGAFVRWAWEQIEPGERRWFHQGLTSSDLTDFALVYRIRESGEILHRACAEVVSALEPPEVRVQGRTHGQSAEQMPLAVRYERWAHLISNARYDCRGSMPDFFGLGGPVGLGIDPRIEAEVAGRYSLLTTPKRGQALHRSLLLPHAEALGRLSQAFAQIALDLRLLSQSGIDEVRLPRPPEHIGSTAMPHKNNPIEWEQIWGLHHLAAGYVSSLRATVPWWLERDISHSSVERVAWPDLFHVVVHQARVLARTLRDLTWDIDQISANLQEGTHDHLRNSSDPSRAYSELARYRR